MWLTSNGPTFAPFIYRLKIVIQTSMNAYADANNCNSRCIGAKDYNGWAQFSWNVPNFASLHNFQPCQSSANPFVWLLYEDKQNRFGTSLDNILNVMADAEFRWM